MADYTALRAELDKPEYSGLSDAEAAALLNTADVVRLKSHFVDPRGLVVILGPAAAATLVATLKAATDPTLQGVWLALSWPGDKDWPAGVDMGNPTSQAMIDQLAAAQLLPAEAAAALKASGTETVTRASLVPGWGVAPVVEQHVALARSLES